jgi:hypothetical protein
MSIEEEVMAMASELVSARQAVRDEMSAFAQQGELRYNKQAPSWSRYEKALLAWGDLPDTLVSSEVPPRCS